MAGTGRFAFNEIVIEPLAKENHVAWFASVKNYLIARDLWEVIDGTFDKPSKEDEDYKQDFVRWRRMNAAALHAIQISCTPKSFNHIMHDSEAKVAWDVLNLIYNYNPPTELPQSEPQEPLTTENSKAWFKGVRNYLIARDLWDVIDGTFERPHEKDEDHKEDFERWTRKNDAALDVIQNSCTPESLSHTRGVFVAKVAWHILLRTHSRLLSQPLFPPQAMGVEVDFDVSDFYKAIRDNNWGAAKAFIDQHPDALCAKLSSEGGTALHVAVIFGHEDIVEELVKIVPPQYLEILDDNGFTPLAGIDAVAGDMTRVAKCMVNKNSNILSIPPPRMGLPVTLAFANGHKEMGHYLYSVTPLECLKSKTGIHGSLLVYWCFIAGDLDVALDLLQRDQELLFAELDGWTPIRGIASMPYAFPSGTNLSFWKQWIYNRVGLLQRIISHAHNLLGMKEIYESKWLHVQAAQILKLICDNVNAMGPRNSIQVAKVREALFCAAKEGIVEFVAQVIKADPSTALSYDGFRRHVFFYAVEYRQAEVFKVIHETRFKNALAARVEGQFGNTMLHEAGNLAPSSRLNHISGAALQMQSELQWFKEVESVVPSGFRVQQNEDDKKAEDIFKESHNELRKDGEKWMKETASSCSVVAALVVTIMFTAAFTVPGGNNQNFGYPIFLKEKLFLLFIISDALSLFSSTTSVLMFLGMLTSRYAEEDFLASLPKKLIIGLSALFFSIATMMIAFSACILIMLQHTYSWSLLPIIMLASVPVTLFVLLQFPLFVEMISSTYGRGMLKRKVKLA